MGRIKGKGRRKLTTDFDYAERDRKKVAAGRSEAYGQLWNIVDGAVKDAFVSHPDYLTSKGLRSARTSVVKRVTGTVMGFATQAAGGRGDAAEQEPGRLGSVPVSPSFGGTGEGGSSLSPPNPHCRIGKVTPKKWSRYRYTAAFARMTERLRGEMDAAKAAPSLVDAVAKAVGQ